MTPTKKAAAMASSVMPLSRSPKKARNWSSGCSGARSMFSTSDTSSTRMSLLASPTTQGTGAVSPQKGWAETLARPQGKAFRPLSGPVPSEGLLENCQKIAYFSNTKRP
ncbi:MAG: hypothetical protein DI623_04905 [Sphingomonas sanxanigenens]|uniref:Uncharacterized protein n=1 Tax=Sphingomonas sanxanigenens TaxID=397260 RepID=A0A2W5AFA1_9SPHN|nr:MAG: hypothetical protein DI623_04905 [Sphingomonas sanxanigenens]